MVSIAMRAKWLKPTVRGLMAFVLVVALILGLGIPAAEVLRAKDYHVHTYVVDVHPYVVTPGAPGLRVESVQSPFWPRYARRLLGRPWRRQPVCGSAPGRLQERCELSHPDVVLKSGGGRFQIVFHPSQAAAYDALHGPYQPGKPRFPYQIEGATGSGGWDGEIQLPAITLEPQ
jgi:hypothetical protein